MRLIVRRPRSCKGKDAEGKPCENRAAHGDYCQRCALAADVPLWRG